MNTPRTAYSTSKRTPTTHLAIYAFHACLPTPPTTSAMSPIAGISKFNGGGWRPRSTARQLCWMSLALARWNSFSALA